MDHMNYGGKVVNFWSWNDKITEAEIVTQLREFADGRFDGVVIHARAGLSIPYMGEKWFSLYECALKTAKALSLDVWIYDEDGWPSGFAGGIVPSIDPSYHLKRLHYGFNQLEIGKGTPVVAYRELAENSFERITLEKAAPGDLFFWYTTEPGYVDLLMPQVTREFIKSTHERYYERFSSYFGNTIQGFFTDEPQLGVPLLWSTLMPDIFREYCGKPLLDSLWLLAVRGEGYKRFRTDFFGAANAQLKTAFTDQIGEWCAKHQVKMTGHFANEDGLGMQICANGGVMVQYSSMQLPGIDHCGNRPTSPVLCKQVSSASAQCGSGEVLSETFGCSGWDVSFADLTWLWGRQVALGVTSACCHLSAYSIKGVRKRDYPAFFSYQSSWWEQFSALKTWMSALSRFMCEGIAGAEVLVISPLSTVASEYDGTYHSERLRECSVQYRSLLQNMLDVQLEFEIGDEKLIRHAGSVVNNRFIVGKRSYSAVFVADCDSLNRFTAELLKRFCENGGRVFFVNRRPDTVDFLPSDLPQKIDGIDISNRRDLIEKTVKKFGLSRYAVLRGIEHEDPCSHIIVRTVAISGTKRIQLCNNSRVSGVSGLLEIDDTVSASSFDCLTGKSQPLAVHQSAGKTYIELSLGSMENIVLEARQNATPETKKPIIAGRQYLVPAKVFRTEKNCLTIDYAVLKIGNEEFGTTPVTKITELLYAQAAVKGSIQAELIYVFNVGNDCPVEEMSLCFESEAVSEIFLNDSPIKPPAQGWWLDRCISEYDISSLVKKGNNTVCLTYHISAGKAVNYGEIFETEKNRFFHQIEPESIYIRGNFDVTVPDFEDHRYSYSVLNPDFVLTAPKLKTSCELTRQGMWFYRGNAVLEYLISKPLDKRRVYLSVDRLMCPVAQWRIGKASGVILSAYRPVDITDFMDEGENILSLSLVSSNRNLLGPHHHMKARPPLVGPHVFTGVRGFEDFVSPEICDEITWTDNYSFVPFGCEGVNIEFVADNHKKR